MNAAALFGLAPRQVTTQPPVAWMPWKVVARAHGWNVSRESAGGNHREWLLNEVRKPTIFRSEGAAERARDAANAEAT